MKLTTSREQLVENIQRYAGSAEDLAELMAYSRPWYALRSEEGWLLALSKFIGYEGMDAETYRRRGIFSSTAARPKRCSNSGPISSNKAIRNTMSSMPLGQ